jgi:hypothetical protein
MRTEDLVHLIRIQTPMIYVAQTTRTNSKHQCHAEKKKPKTPLKWCPVSGKSLATLVFSPSSTTCHALDADLLAISRAFHHPLIQKLTLKKLVMGSSALRIWTWKKAASAPLQPSLGHCTGALSALSQAPGPPKTSSLSLRVKSRRLNKDVVIKCWYGQVRHSRRFLPVSGDGPTVRMLEQWGQTAEAFC